MTDDLQTCTALPFEIYFKILIYCGLGCLKSILRFSSASKWKKIRWRAIKSTSNFIRWQQRGWMASILPNRSIQSSRVLIELFSPKTVLLQRKIPNISAWIFFYIFKQNSFSQGDPFSLKMATTIQQFLYKYCSLVFNLYMDVACNYLSTESTVCPEYRAF